MRYPRWRTVRMTRPLGSTRRRSRRIRTSRALRVGIPPGQPARARSVLLATAPSRFTRCPARRASTGGNAIWYPSKLSTPSSSIDGALAFSARRARVRARASMSSSLAGIRTQSSRGSDTSGGAESSATTSNLGLPDAVSCLRRSPPPGHGTRETSIHTKLGSSCDTHVSRT